ncbi:MAG: HipA N-terminal domain-containing protein [Deltaproteobacteria bacterium]|nr:HipA N-terminal domain-containing protein [Deltaproteobacteria bacterium]MBW1848416.1 HipA N-terminal domain-containing protein [Deltaproteobacteria bacterium]MBW1984979.1 HipA N-terminal domain-containing protein [Deltaproteobacteria bacterium]MBW2364846.1 HipA N-terminal domain-containing protein [Deltaproteobacteria bacterium]
MRSAEVFVNDNRAGILEEISKGNAYRFIYDKDYFDSPVSLMMPIMDDPYTYDRFPPFFEGLLPEGYNLEALLRTDKIDRDDLFSQLIAVGMDMVGAVTVRELK